MSGAILRRNSSKEGLRNLLRVTAQRSVEDAEELERERRRRARESFRRTSSTVGGPSLDHGNAANDALYDGEMKPSSSPSLEEDEGFSDWTQRLERRRQQRMEELGQRAEEERPLNGASKSPAATPAASRTPASARLQRQMTERGGERVGETENDRKKREREEEAFRKESTQKERKDEEETMSVAQMRVPKKTETIQAPEAEAKEKRFERKVSYTSKVFLQQEPKNSVANGNAASEEVTSCVSVKTRKTPRPVVQALEAEEAAAILETERRLEKIRRSHQEKESQELEQLRQKQAEAEQELEELKARREERRRVRGEEERRREEEEHQRLAKEEEERRRMKEDMERRRLEAAERMRHLSTSSVDGEEVFSPLSPKGPTNKITERTESLNRSLKKSNSFKKTQPPVLLSRMDDRLELYTHAIENSQEAKAAKQGLLDVLSPTEPVAAKKNLFEAGETWGLSPTKGPPCKDTEGLKVGVADLITQWVKGNPDTGSKQSPTKPNDVRPGDVMQKKNMWEVIGDSSGGPGITKGTTSIKRYKFVVTGHGKYEKMAADHDNAEEYTNGKSGN
ncbi:uncharacterized protein lsp1a [Aplochiton taeniatus]